MITQIMSCRSGFIAATETMHVMQHHPASEALSHGNNIRHFGRTKAGLQDIRHTQIQRLFKRMFIFLIRKQILWEQVMWRFNSAIENQMDKGAVVSFTVVSVTWELVTKARSTINTSNVFPTGWNTWSTRLCLHYIALKDTNTMFIKSHT
jgi:hypothetical protein